MEIARHWRLKEQRYNLKGDICPVGHLTFPPRPICVECTKPTLVRRGESGFLLFPNNQVIHSEVIR